MLAAAAHAQDAESVAQQPESKDVPSYPVRGVVLDALTHEPIPRVLVESDGNAVLTASDGRFELNLPEGKDQVDIRRPGYAQGPNTSHTVKVGADTPELAFELTRQASITGHVLLSTGDNADGIRFTAFRKTVVGNRERWAAGGGGTTNAEGVFHMADLTAPSIYILCSVPSRENLGRRLNRPQLAVGNPAANVAGFPSVCYPGPLPSSSAAANALTLAPGQQADFEVILNRQPFFPVTIGVLNAVRGRGLGLQVHDQTGRTLEFIPEWKSQQGIVEVHLPDGQYSLQAQSIDPPQGSLFGSIEFQVAGRALTGLTMALLPLRPIPVEVRREFTAPVQAGAPERAGGPSGTGIEDEDGSQGFGLSLLSADSAIADTAGGIGQSRNSSGRPGLQLEGILPGRYWVQTYVNGAYVSSIASGGVDLTREPLTVGPGGASAAIQVTLRNDVGEIQCTVNGGRRETVASGEAAGELAVSYIYAVPVSRSMTVIPQGQAEGEQPVTLSGLAPGQYRVLAFDRAVEIDLNDPQQLSVIVSHGQTVTVSPGSTANVQLERTHAVGAAPENEEVDQ